jgi:uncharacterized protein (TIGR02284 family)
MVLGNPDGREGLAAASLAGSLRNEHDTLANLLNGIVDFVKREDLVRAGEEWADLEDLLLRHMDAEEMFLLPAFEVDQAGQSMHLRSDHALIRTRLGEIGLAFELHTVRVERVSELAAFLGQHANEENASLYLWAENTKNAPLLRAASRHLSGQRSDRTFGVAVLESLLRVCKDGERGYRRASALSRDDGYRIVFKKYADQRGSFEEALRGRLQSLGDGGAVGHRSFLGALHRGWIETGAFFKEDNPVALLRECERGELAALKAYRIALHAELEPRLHEEVEGQYEAIKGALEEVRALLANERR